MALRTWTSKTIGVQRDTFEYACIALANGDTTIPLEIGQFADKTVHICNDFGTSGSITFYGSNRDADVTRDGQGVITGHATEPVPAAQISGTQPVSGSVTATLAAASIVAGAFQRAVSATTNGIITFHHLISAATTNATSVKASAGTIANIELTNNSASMKFFKLYNKASAPTVGTDTPILTLGIPANGVRSFVPPVEWRLATGIAYAITGAPAVADTTAVALNDVAVSIGYL